MTSFTVLSYVNFPLHIPSPCFFFFLKGSELSLNRKRVTSLMNLQSRTERAANQHLQYGHIINILFLTTQTGEAFKRNKKT